MEQTARKFINRAPRYILRTTDNQMLRFAAHDDSHRSHTTRFINISETGLAFLIDRSSCPNIGEFIKLEFPVPGGEQIAWFGKVVRIEEYNPHPWWSDKKNEDPTSEIVVGVRFHDLPEGHKRSISSHLQEKFKQLYKDKQIAAYQLMIRFFVENLWKMFIYSLAAALAAGILYFLSLPTATYDAKHGSPWGQRFK